MTFQDLKAHVERHVADMRRLEYCVNAEGFESLYQKQPEWVIEQVKIAGTSTHSRIRDAAIEALKFAVRKENQVDETLEDLRRAASFLGIPRYTKLDVITLRSAVQRRRNDVRDSGPSNGHARDLTQMRPLSGGDSL